LASSRREAGVFYYKNSLYILWQGENELT